MLSIGIVSPGAMGSALGAALVAGGATVVTTVAGRSSRTALLATGLEQLESLDAVVASSELVLSVVPPGAARAVARAICDASERTRSAPLVADLNAIAPATALDIVEILDGAGLELVDGSISGPPPRPDRETRIYLSGERAGAVGALAAPGVVWRVVGDDVGRASAVKMSTASVYKGSVALLVQALRTAHENGVLGPVLDDLSRAFPELAGDPSGTVQRAGAKAARYVAEMEEIAATQAAAGLTPALFAAMAVVYGELATTTLGSVDPEEVDAGLDLAAALESL